jgi:hypothetical protein
MGLQVTFPMTTASLRTSPIDDRQPGDLRQEIDDDSDWSINLDCIHRSRTAVDEEDARRKLRLATLAMARQELEVRKLEEEFAEDELAAILSRKEVVNAEIAMYIIRQHTIQLVGPTQIPITPHADLALTLWQIFSPLMTSIRKRLF